MREVLMCCTTCPSGCALTVQADGDKIVSVTGNACKRGLIFAEKELTAPERMLTSTVCVQSGGETILLPVKSEVPMPRAKMLDVMAVLRDASFDAPIHRGDVLVSNAVACGVNIVACKTVE